MNTKKYLKIIGWEISLIILLLILFNTAILAQLPHDILSEKIKNNTVKLTCEFPGGSPEHRSGFGFILGEQKEFLYIATAKHVVIGYSKYEEKFKKASSVNVEFYNPKGKGIVTNNVEILDLNIEKLDFSVLEVPKPNGFVIIDGYFSTDVKRGDKAWYIGRDNSWFVPAQLGIVNNLSTTNGEIVFEISTVKEGTSGAPLLTNKGIVGLITKDEGSTASAIQMLVIKDLVRQHNYPMMNVPVTSNAEVSYRVAQNIDSHSTPEVKTAMYKISPGALKALMNTGTASWTTNRESWTDQQFALEELSRLGLLKLNLGIPDISYKVTSQGDTFYHSLLDIIFDVLRKNQFNAPPEVQRAVSSVSKEALIEFVNIGEKSWKYDITSLEWSSRKSVFEELSDQRLIQFLQLTGPGSTGNDYEVTATALGKETYHSLQNTVINVLNRAKTQYYVDENEL